MSTKAKGIQIDKILKQFDLADIDDQVSAFEQIREHLNANLESHYIKLENRGKVLDAYKEKIKK